MRKSHRTIAITGHQEDKQSKVPSTLPHQDDCKSRKDTKQCTTKHRTNTEPHYGSNRIKNESRLVPHVDKAPLPLRILRLVTSNCLQVENPTHPTAHAPERASVYILGQFRTSKWEMNMYWKLKRFAALSFRYKVFQILLLLVISILIIFSMCLHFDVIL